nr:TIGR00303 family protein [Laspinema sp. D3c]
MPLVIRIYTQLEQGQQWLDRYRAQQPHFACILGFTETGLIPAISAAGATPRDRQYTAIADAEFLYSGPRPHPQYPLPPLQAGASPVLISRAVLEAQGIPLTVFNAGLPHPPAVPAVELEGTPARCLSTGKALEAATVQRLFEAGLHWGQKLAQAHPEGYVIVGECVVGGTTTALSVLMDLGIDADGKVNSSHPLCNHQQKLALVQAGLAEANRNRSPLRQMEGGITGYNLDPLMTIAAVGDPMQAVAAGMAIAASRLCGVLLAGGTQMLAVYALIQAVASYHALPWNGDRIVVGTTRWVAEDPTGDTVGLAQAVGPVPLLATQLSFADSRYPQLSAYERGFVKEGVGAGGCAIAAHLYKNWNQSQLLQAIEALTMRYARLSL